MSRWRRIATAAAVLTGGLVVGAGSAGASPDYHYFQATVCDDMVTLEFFQNPSGTGGLPGDYADIVSTSVNVGILDEDGWMVSPWIDIDIPGLEVGQRLALEGQFHYYFEGSLAGVELPEGGPLWFRMEFTWGHTVRWIGGPPPHSQFVETLATEMDDVVPGTCPSIEPSVVTEPPVITEAPVITEPAVVTEPPTVTQAPADTAAPVTKAPVASSTIATSPVPGDPPRVSDSPVEVASAGEIAAVNAPIGQQLPSTGGGGSTQMLVLAAAGSVLLGGALLGATRRR